MRRPGCGKRECATLCALEPADVRCTFCGARTGLHAYRAKRSLTSVDVPARALRRETTSST